MHKQAFKVSRRIIWLSSFFVSVLISVPKFAERPFNAMDTLVNSCLTFVFSLFVWYYNIYTLPRYSARDINKGFSVMRLIKSLLLGMGIMFVLAALQQVLLAYLDFGAAVIMIQMRGILVNLIFYMFMHLLYQSYQNQQVGIELERTKSDNLGAQYELLKQQVNPHFLFNSLNTLKFMAESNDRHTVEFIIKLSNFYRFTLESRKMDVILLSEELEILNAYLFLLKARFEEGLQLNIDINQQYHRSFMPPFTIQLLIENCIKHNIVSLDHPLRIDIYIEGQAIVIANQLQLKLNPESSMGMGLENINQRYIHLVDQQITIDPTDKTFKVKLPIIYEYHHH